MLGCPRCGSLITHAKGVDCAPVQVATVINTQPYSNAEIAEFEQLIFACNSDDGATRVLARALISQFIRTHGKAKCDLMLDRLTKAHEAAAGAE